jgi:hypothetical protein
MDAITPDIAMITERCMQLDSCDPFLSLFTAEGEPMSVVDHFHLCPMFTFSIPSTLTFQCGRQVGKTYGLSTQTIMRSGMRPNFNTLTIQPRMDQLQRYNNTIYVPILKSCIIADSLIERVEMTKLMSKRFRNGSISHMEYAFTSPDRVRGISGIAQLNVDEAQDIEDDFIPVLKETMSASKLFGFTQFTGTPKTQSTALTMSFEDSSKAEWTVPCSGCSKSNVAAVRQDLMKMIGSKGLVCARCGKALNTREGFYEHEIPARRRNHPGYHISQVTHPRHCEIPHKWDQLLEKLQNYSATKFHNEVLGEPYDDNIRLLAVEDLIHASNGLDGTIETALRKRRLYPTVALGIDWSGGGNLSNSFTTVAVVGTRPGSEVLDCIYAERLRPGLFPEQEAEHIAALIGRFTPQFIAHDYGGAGYVRESMLRQAGVGLDRIVPLTYVFASGKNIIVRQAATGGSRSSYSLDKARSLAVMVTLIRNKKIGLPDYEQCSRHGNVLDDLLNLIEVPKEMPRGDVVYLIGRKPRRPDDFAHSLNFACSAIWFLRGSYPKLADVGKYELNPELVAQAFPEKGLRL